MSQDLEIIRLIQVLADMRENKIENTHLMIRFLYFEMFTHISEIKVKILLKHSFIINNFMKMGII
jgi:hypothetical protein